MVNTASEEINSPKVYGSIGLAHHVENKMWNKLGKKTFPRCLTMKRTPMIEKGTN